jgi:argininosuccinate synthase
MCYRAHVSFLDVSFSTVRCAGGLDTSIILKWLQDTYGCEVVTFTADLGQVR